MKQRYWRSSLCEKVELIDIAGPGSEDYEVGDTEPCLCGDLRCAATVEESAGVIQVVGSSPAERAARR
jgi:hypothetical protein